MSFIANRQVEELSGISPEDLMDVENHYKAMEVIFDKAVEDFYDYKKKVSSELYKQEVSTSWFEMTPEMRDFIAMYAGAYTLSEFLFFLEGIMYTKEKMEVKNG